MGCMGLHEILDTFTISGARKKRIIYRINSIQEEQGPLTFDELYRTVSDFALDCELYASGLLTSIDDVAKHAELITPPVDSIDVIGQVISSSVIANMMKDSNLSPIATAFLFNLMSKDEIELLEMTASPQEVNERTLDLIEELNYRRFRKIRQQPIKKVTVLSGIEVLYGTRSFNGNYLSFAKQHIDIYGNLTSRTEFSVFDPYLYSKLASTGEIKEIIPQDHSEKLWEQLGCTSALHYYQLFYGHKKPGVNWGRKNLQDENSALHRHMLNEGSLDEVFPKIKKRLKKWQKEGYPSALAYFNEHYKGKVDSRYQLSNMNSQMYSWLVDEGSMDKALPKKR